MNSRKDYLDRLFSAYIRRRDCRDDIGRCIRCGRPITFSTCDCGHYIPRAHTATRWNELNCAAQCRTCNRYEYGNSAGFAAGLIERYGPGVLDRLNASKHVCVKLTPGDYERLINYYSKKWHEIK